jgi:hypothetical protein
MRSVKFKGKIRVLLALLLLVALIFGAAHLASHSHEISPSHACSTCQLAHDFNSLRPTASILFQTTLVVAISLLVFGSSALRVSVVQIIPFRAQAPPSSFSN